MTIIVEGPGGVTVEFPDGTAPDTIKLVMSRQFSEAPTKNTREHSTVESFGRGALQGASFGLSDEIGAGIEGATAAGSEILDFGKKVFMAPTRAISSAIGIRPSGSLSESAGKAIETFSPAFEKSLEEIRAANDESYQQNPWTYTAGSLTGGVASTAIPILGQVGKVGQGATLGTKTYEGAKAGALLGGLGGFGHSRGGIDNRASGAATGVVAGSILGGILPSAVASGGAVVNAVGNRLQAARNPKSRAESLVGQALLDDIAPNATPKGAQIRVDRKLQQVQGAVDTRRATPGNPAPGDATPRLMDVGGENTRNLLRAAANQKSKAVSTLNKHLDARQVSQWRRLERGIVQAVSPAYNSARRTSIPGIAHVEPEEAVEVLIETARTKSKPWFDKAFSAKIPVTNELVDVLNRPGIKRLAELAQESAANEGKDLSKVNAVELLHSIKMQIDRQIGQAKRGIQDSKASWDVRTLVKLKKDLVKAIRVPEYRRALQLYSGPSAIRNALEDGFDDALSATPQAIKMKLQDLSGDAAEAYRVGLANKLIQKLRQGNETRDRTANLFSSPDVKKLVSIMAPNTQAKRELQKLLAVEGRMATTRRAVQGNSTTAKQLTQLQEGASAASDVRAAGNALMGRLGPIVETVSRHVARIGGMTPDVANEVIKAAMATTGNQSQAALQRAIARARASDSGQEELARILLRMGIAALNGSTEPRG